MIECLSAFPFRLRCTVRLALLLGIFSLLSMLTGCGSSGTASDAPTTARVQQTNLTSSSNPLVAQYSVTITGAGMVSVQFGQTTSYGFQTSAQSLPKDGGTANILVAGMKQNTLYHMRAVVTSSDGQVVDQDQDQTFQTGTIPPAMIPTMTVTTTPGQQPTPGIQLVSLAGEAFAIDLAGNVIWYYNYPAPGGPNLVKLLPNGDMLMILQTAGPPATSELLEIDLAGNIVRQLDLPTLAQKLRFAGYDVNALSIDHDVLLLPNNHLLMITSNSKVFTDLPGYPGQTTVEGNAIVDVDGNNNPVWVWDAFDHLDVNRHPMNFPDWTHCNSLAYTSDGNFLLSSRHQRWVMKIDYENGIGSGQVLWRLGYQGDFTLLNSDSPADWFSAQHDANVISANSTGDYQLAMFDNGDYRVLDDNGDTCNPNGTPPCYSTATIFEVNETNLTAQRLWTWQRPYSFWGGSVQELPNSNMFVDETAPADINANTSRVSEVTQQNNPTVIWQLVFDNQPAYRTLHMPSLYPGVQW